MVPEAQQGGNETGTTPAGQDAEANTAPEFKAITSQEDLDAVIKARLDRERSKYGDYKELKAKAARLDEVEKERIAREKAEQEATSARASLIRYRVAAANGISVEDADLFLTGTDEETITAQAQRLVERTAATNSAPESKAFKREGSNPNPAPNDERRAFLRNLTGRSA